MNSNGASQSLLVTTLASAFILFSAASGDAELELASGLAVLTGIGCMDWRSAMAGYQMACNDCGRPMPPFRDVGWTVFLRMLPPWIFGLGTLVLFMWLG